MDLKRLVGGFVLFACVLIGATPAFAQGVGAVRGTVLDESKGVLPGATVTLTNTAGGVGGNQTTTSDARGSFEFLRLVPGTYLVVAELEGFRRFEQREIVVETDRTSRVDAVLTIGGLAEAVTVSSEAPLLDTTNALQQTVLSKDVIEALPNRTDVWAMMRVVPGVVVGKMDVGGSEAFLQSSVTVNGSNNNKYMVDGMESGSVDGTGNLAGIYLDPYAFEQVSFQAGGGDATVANSGMTVNMVTRSGTNVMRGGFIINGTSPRLSSQNLSPALRAQILGRVPARVLAANPNLEPHARLDTMYDYGANLSGPWMRDKLWFVFTWHDQRLDQYRLGAYNPDGTQGIDDNVLQNFTSNQSWQMNPTSQLSFFSNWQYKLNGHRGGGTFAEDDARQYNYKPWASLYQVKFVKTLGPRTVADVQSSSYRLWDVYEPQSGIPLGAVATNDTVTQSAGVAAATYQAYHQTRDQYSASLTTSAGAHTIRAGFQSTYTRRPIKTWTLSGMRANFSNGVPVNVNTYTLPIARHYTDEGLDVQSDTRSFETGLYVQDRWQIGRKLVLNVGGRFETSRSWIPATRRPDSMWLPGQDFDRTDAPSFKDPSVRINAVYDVFGDGRTALKFVANRFNQLVNLSLINRLNPVSTTNDTRAWTVCAPGQVTACDVNGDRIPQVAELGPSNGYNFSGVNASYAPDMKRPVSNDFSFEVQQALPQRVVVSVAYIYRQLRNNIGQMNTAQPLERWTGPITVTERVSGETVQVWNRPAVGNGNFFFNSPDSDENYKGVEISASKRMSNRWSVHSGASFGQNIRKGYTGDLNNPNNRLFTDEHAGNTIPWSYRASAVILLPFGLSYSQTWQYQAGAYEDTTVLVNNQTIALAQGTQTVQVAPRGDTKLPPLAQLDLSLRRIFRAGSRTISPRFDIFNATNQASVQERITQLGPTYHDVISVQRGRLIKLGLTVDF